MKRGEIWTVSGGNGCAGKPRPVVILQDNTFAAAVSITVCAFTSDTTEAPFFRLMAEPSKANGLTGESRLMVDKITTVHKSKLGKRIWQMAERDMLRLNQSIIVFLGLVASTETPPSESD